MPVKAIGLPSLYLSLIRGLRGMDVPRCSEFIASKHDLQNIIYVLFDRESGIDRRFVARRIPKHFNEEFFKCIPPNLTISNVYKPKNFFRKFSPDGKYLMCFSKDLRSFENYEFLGTSSAASLLYNWKSEYISAENNTDLGLEIRANIFRRLFQLNWSIQLTTFVRPLFREFSIFTEDASYVVVASLRRIQEENLPSHTLNSINPIQYEYDLNCYTFYMVKLSDGTISDTIEYNYDYINLSHNHGVSIKGDMLAIVSLFHQWINIIQIKNGKFVTLFTIGKYSHEIDECLCTSVPEYREECPILESRYSRLNQKLLCGLYKNIFKCKDENSIQRELKLFYRRFEMYESMKIFKVQLIDNENILIRYENKFCTSLDGNTVTKLFVIYNMSTNEITNIYSESSKHLFQILTRFFDDLRNTQSIFTGRAPSSASNNIYVRYTQKRLESGQDGEEGAAYRFLRQFPISSQSYSVSPYLDLNLFQYDERLVSTLERPRYSSAAPIIFSDRNTGLTKFRLFPGVVTQHSIENDDRSRTILPCKTLSAFIFHPFEPFAISVQKLSNRFVTNIHIRNEGTILNVGP